MSKQNKSRKLPLGIIVILIVSVYLIYHAVSFFSRDLVSVFEIGEATRLCADRSYNGLIIRNEIICSAENSGKINFLIKNGTRISQGENVGLIYRGSQTDDRIAPALSANRLEASDYNELTGDISDFSLIFRPDRFDKIYDFKSSLENYLHGKLNIISDSELSMLLSPVLYYCESKDSGIVEYYTDGFEGFDPASVTRDKLNKSSYSRKDIKSGDGVAAGDNIFKVINSEEWSIIIPLSDEDTQTFAGKNRVKVLFDEIGLSTTVLFEMFKGADGEMYGKLTLTKYMIRYADTRFLRITILSDSPSGLKLPVSSLVSSELYAIPIDYVTKGENADPNEIYLEKYDKGYAEIQKISNAIVYKDDSYAYIPLNMIPVGSTLQKPRESYILSDAKLVDSITMPEDNRVITGRFYRIPVRFINTDSSGKEGFFTVNKTANDNAVIFSPASFICRDKNYVYVLANQFAAGTTLLDSNTVEKTVIDEIRTIDGVYYISKGYASFRAVNILDRDQDYVIVQKGTYMGISSQDYILLKGSEGYQEKIIYQ